MTSPVIVASGLSKNFGRIQAVDDLSFSVSEGEVYGFLGQNGAGKSTTIRMLLTLVKPSAGSVRIFGKDLQSHRRSILQQVGAIIEKPDLYKYLTALQNLRIVARLSGIHPTTGELLRQLEVVGIKDRAYSKVRTFSQGMKQRLGIACALIHRPELIILDEPTNGLDPQGIADVRNLILHLSKNEGRTVFVSSHLLSEIELTADVLLIIDRGKKMAEGKVSELLNPADTLVEVQTENDEATLLYLRSSAWEKELQDAENKIRLRMHKQRIPALVKDLVAAGHNVVSVQSKHSLEDYFLTLTTANQHVAAYTY